MGKGQQQHGKACPTQDSQKLPPEHCAGHTVQGLQATLQLDKSSSLEVICHFYKFREWPVSLVKSCLAKAVKSLSNFP